MKNPTPYLKMRVIGAIEFAAGTTIQERCRDVAGTSFIDEDGQPHTFTWRTIQTWYSRYRTWGITSMHNKERSDKGKTRKVSAEQLLEAIEQVRGFFHEAHPKKVHIYRAAIERGLLRPETVSKTSFYRLVNGLELLKPDSENRRRLAFSKQFANQMWQADTMFGPYVPDTRGDKAQAKLIAFIDDASRVVCHGEFFFRENSETLLNALRCAIYKRGLPEQLYVDNGAIYSCKEISLTCARLGIILCHAPVRDGAAKGKIERFFRNVRESFLSRNLDLSSLDALNKAFTLWVEDEYNSKTHSTLQMKPIDRFGLDLKRIRFIAISEATDEIFFVEEDRSVRTDNTFPLKNIRFETPADLPNRKIQVRFDRKNFAPNKVIVYYKGQRIGPARPVDLIANDRPPRPSSAGETNSDNHPSNH
jgi:transposase InsO family protein